MCRHRSVVSACDADATAEPLAHQIDDARAHVDQLRTEVDAHAAAAQDAADLAGMQALEPMHDDEARGHMDLLGHAIGDIQMCEGALDDDGDSMMDAHDDCAEELERHAQAMSEAADLAAARAEEQLHRSPTMMERLDDLDTMGPATRTSRSSGRGTSTTIP